MPMTEFARNAMCNHLTGQASFTLPGPNLWLALFNSTVAGGSLITQTPPYPTEVSPTGTSYARFQITTSPAQAVNGWHQTGTPGRYQNNGVWDFGTATGAGWGTVSAVGLMSSGTPGDSGQAYLVSDLTTPRTVNVNESFNFQNNAYDIDYSLANNAGSELSVVSVDRMIRLLIGLQDVTISARTSALYDSTAAVSLPNSDATTGEVPTGGGTNYSRQPVEGIWDAASGGASANNAQINYTAASSDYPNDVANLGILGTISGTPEVLWWTPNAEPPTPITIQAGVAPRIDVGVYVPAIT